MQQYDEDDFIYKHGKRVRIHLESRGFCNLLALLSFLILYFAGTFKSLLFSQQYMWLIIWILAVPYLTGFILYIILVKRFKVVKKIDRTLDFLVPLIVLAMFVCYLSKS